MKVSELNFLSFTFFYTVLSSLLRVVLSSSSHSTALEFEEIPPPCSFQPGDWVIESFRPQVLLRFQSLDPDGWFCRCQDADRRKDGKRGEVCYLLELEPAPLELLQLQGIKS
jgi:hypothetical protein